MLKLLFRRTLGWRAVAVLLASATLFVMRPAEGLSPCRGEAYELVVLDPVSAEMDGQAAPELLDEIHDAGVATSPRTLVYFEGLSTKIDGQGPVRLTEAP